MTKDDIIRMARRAGIIAYGDIRLEPESIEYFANLVATAEREACAMVAMEFRRGAGSPVCADVAEAILARRQS